MINEVWEPVHLALKDCKYMGLLEHSPSVTNYKSPFNCCPVPPLVLNRAHTQLSTRQLWSSRHPGAWRHTCTQAALREPS